MFMTEEEKKEIETKSEEEILNWEKPKTFTLEEVETIKKEMQSNSEKGVQKILNEKKAFEKAMSSLWDISDDPTKLIELFSENEEAGKIILDKYYDWLSIEDFKASIDYKVDVNDPKVIEKLIEDKVNARETEKSKAKTEKEIDDKKEQFIKDLKMSDDELKNFEEMFEDRKNLKSFSLKTIDKQLSRAYTEANWENSKLKEVEAIAKSLWTTGWKSTWKINSKDTEKEKIIADTQAFMKKFNL